MIVGWSEWVQLPELNISALRAKIDTGAKTSALHAENIDVRNGVISFTTSPDPARPDWKIKCSAPVFDERQVTNSGGQSEMRYVIQTTLVLGPLERTIEITLNDRSRMRFRMLLGREAFEPGMIVDPTACYLQPTLVYT